jgi:hypothetical protein
VKPSYIRDDGCDPLLIIPGKYRLKTVRHEQIKKFKNKCQIGNHHETNQDKLYKDKGKQESG